MANVVSKRKTISPDTISTNRSPDPAGVSELNQFASEFAKLVDRYEPARGKDQPVKWLRRLPTEVFEYYRWGITSYGSTAQTPIERRGRLYLMHTALLFMWMSWGRKAAKQRFRTSANKGTRRVASIVTLECYRLANVIRDYKIGDWFWQPVQEWMVDLVSQAVDLDAVSNANQKVPLKNNETVPCSINTFSDLRTQGAVPEVSELTL